VLVLALACETSVTSVEAPETPDGEPESPAGGGPSIHGEVGALDEDETKKAFGKARPSIDGCLARANDGLSYEVVAGDVEVVVRVANDGSVRFTYATSSTIGRHDTERCILEALARQTWPRPEGGEDGIASTSYSIEPAGREAVEWSPGDLGPQGSTLKDKLRACQSEAGTAGLSVTMYIDPDGKLLSAGVASADEHGLDAARCALDAARSQRYPSPGSYPAKVTVMVP
jgi:hypothetical protein